MRGRRKVDEVALRIIPKLQKDEVNVSIDDIMFIVSRFFHYAKESLLNNKIIVSQYKNGSNMRLSFSHELARPLGKIEKFYYFFSKKILSKIFLVKVMYHYDTAWCDFIPDQQFASEIQNILDTDLVYKYVKT